MASERPGFLKTLSPRQTLVDLPIPQAFARSYMKNIDEDKKVTLFTPLAKFWHVSIRKSDGDCLYLSHGWQEFASAYELNEGDTVLFKYEGNMIFTLEMFSSSGCSIFYTGAARKVTMETQNLQTVSESATKKKKKKNQNLKKQPKVEQVSGMSIAANSNPSIRLDRPVKDYNLTKSFMAIPGSYLSSVGLRMKENINIKDCQGREWPMKMRKKPSGSEYYLTAGWKMFAKEKGLKGGDKCVFTAISETVMNVQVVKGEAEA